MANRSIPNHSNNNHTADQRILNTVLLIRKLTSICSIISTICISVICICYDTRVCHI